MDKNQIIRTIDRKAQNRESGIHNRQSTDFRGRYRSIFLGNYGLDSSQLFVGLTTPIITTKTRQMADLNSRKTEPNSSLVYGHTRPASEYAF